MKILAFAASLRDGSFNRQLLSLAVDHARQVGAEVDVVHFRELAPPLYNADDQHSTGFPPETEEWKRRVEEADGMIIASPEYNFSLPGTLKNAIDWISRMRPVPLRGKSALLRSASSGHVGGIRGLWQLRIPLEGLGVFVYPDMYTLPWAATTLDDAGRLVEPERDERLKSMVEGYLSAAKKLAGE